MNTGSVLFFNSEPAQRFAGELSARGTAAQVAPSPTLVSPPDPRAWHRAVSELALFNWLLLPTPEAAEVLIESIGAPPGPTLRIAAVSPAGDVLRAEGRTSEVEAPGLRAALERLTGRLGRRERILVPHCAAAGRRVGEWLEALGAEAVCRIAYDLDLTAEPLESPEPYAAVVASTAEAETLASYLLAERVRDPLPVAALDQATADAAEDCGLSVSAISPDGLGAFLDSAVR